MSMVHVSKHPLAQTTLSTLRDKATDAALFRSGTDALTSLLAYEATTSLETAKTNVETPLGTAWGSILTSRVYLVPILRAALGMEDAFLRLLPNATVRHLGVYRDEDTARPVRYYDKIERLDEIDLCLVLDPMLATGGTACAAIDTLKKKGARRIAYVGVIGSQSGVDRLTKKHPDVRIFLAAVDEHLNEHHYIVPGLGDAGDRYYGTLA